jgi:hypothetical protein
LEDRLRCTLLRNPIQPSLDCPAEPGFTWKGVRLIPVDLLEPHDVRSKRGSLKEVTHIVFGAYIEKPTAREKNLVNVAILRNLLDVVEAASPGLEHVTFYQGGKAYGADLGPFKTPAREDGWSYAAQVGAPD